MSKAPIPGRCKTRLAPRLGLRGAARLQRRLIHQRLRLALDCGHPVEIHASPDIRHPSFLKAKRMGCKLRKQWAGDLGQRMARAQAKRPAIIIGTDCPALTQQHLAEAEAAMAAGISVCIPATDGGYVLIGQVQPQAQIFQSIDWGSSKVFRQTLRQQRRDSSTWVNKIALDDLDSPRDYKTQRVIGLISAF